MHRRHRQPLLRKKEIYANLRMGQIPLKFGRIGFFRHGLCVKISLR